MPTPNLLHPIAVKLRKADKKFTAAWDENAGEAVGEVRRKVQPIDLFAQIGRGDSKDPRSEAGGIEEKSDGYLLFLTRDLQAKHVTIERGDRVIQIGSGKAAREVDFFITKVQWRGHYPEHAGPTLLKAFFADRKPSRSKEV